MPKVVFTRNLQVHVELPPSDVEGETVSEALEAVFTKHEVARGYVLDEGGAVRRHMVIFVNGKPIQDREALSDPVPADGEIYVMQALSGG